MGARRPLLAGIALLFALAPLPLAVKARAAVVPAAQDLSAAGQHALSPQVAIDSQDRATVVWMRLGLDGTNYRVQSVRLGADGAPGAVQGLSAAGQDAYNPQVAIDSQDRATVVWERSDGTNRRIQSLRLGADGAPGAVQDLSAAGQNAGGPQVAIDSQDRATVVWERSDGTNNRIQSVRLGADGAPSSVQELSAAGQHAGGPQVAIDSQDRATVVWGRFDGTNNRIQSVRLGADGAPGSVQALSAAGQDAYNPQVAIDSQDRATVVWQRLDGTHYRVQSERLDADGAPGALQNLSAPGDHALFPQVAIDSQDRATVVWWLDGPQRAQSLRLGAGGAPDAAVQNLSADAQDPSGFGLSYGPQVAIDSQDRARVLWQRYDGTSYRIQSVRLGADGAPGALQDLSAAGQDARSPQIAIDSHDRATVVWERFDGTSYRVQAVRLGSIPPTTTIDSGPLGPTKSNLSTFVFSASEHGSSFECRVDGGAFGPCSGPGASHSTGFLPEGPHTFRVRATDPAGNVGAPAQRDFTVDTTPPSTQIDSGPSGLTNDSTPSFSFSADEPGSAFQCRMDGDAWSACASPKSYPGIAGGPHTFDVRATDPAGNADPSPPRRSFTLEAASPAGDTTPPAVDNTAPGTSIGSAPVAKLTEGPQRKTTKRRATFEFRPGEPGSSFECKLDKRKFKPCTSPHRVKVKPGKHVFQVRAIDEDGNVGKPVKRSWAVKR